MKNVPSFFLLYLIILRNGLFGCYGNHKKLQVAPRLPLLSQHPTTKWENFLHSNWTAKDVCSENLKNLSGVRKIKTKKLEVNKSFLWTDAKTASHLVIVKDISLQRNKTKLMMKSSFHSSKWELSKRNLSFPKSGLVRSLNRRAKGFEVQTMAFAWWYALKIEREKYFLQI